MASKRKRRSRKLKIKELPIKNFGLLWERRFIKWGRGRTKGHLKGRAKRRKSKIADFRDQIGIYVLYDKDLKSIYVGQAGRGKDKKLFNRLKRHRSDHLGNRWAYFSWFGLRKINRNGTLYDRDTPQKQYSARGQLLLDQFEGALIAVAEPLLNKQGSKWRGAEEFYQQVDEDTREITVDEVYSRQNAIFDEQAKVLKKLGEIEKKLRARNK